MKIKVGIFFGGPSREREISFAGGRTVYDNLNKALFEPIPLFVDSYRNIVLLDWQYIYKGSIRDFFPPVNALPPTPNGFQIYLESLGDRPREQRRQLLEEIGRPVALAELPNLIDVAFLALHGEYGEDGQIQQQLTDLGIPYTGSGVRASEIGMNKALQKELMGERGFARPKVEVLQRQSWLGSNVYNLYARAGAHIGFPLVIRPANQGSSIGVSIIDESDGVEGFERAVNRAFFRELIPLEEWHDRGAYDRAEYARTLGDIRDGLGFPLDLSLGNRRQTVYHPEELLRLLNDWTASAEHLSQIFVLEAHQSEKEVILESFIRGKEFSCIVIRAEDGSAIALPPTEIVKGGEVFDYRSKYLPGLSRKETPIDLPLDKIEAIRRECERLFTQLGFQVYARIDGFFTDKGEIFLNDPNTTSGMLPSSFFFHQAAEIGLNPSQFLSFVLRASLQERLAEFPEREGWRELLRRLDEGLRALQSDATQRRRIGVIMGGASFERHISVESGRNVFEKLSSSAKYEPLPIFLTGDGKSYELNQLPINLLLKDNADDIRAKIDNWKVHPLIDKIKRECAAITRKYASANTVFQPETLSYGELAERVDGVFIALHGRPGEDGQVQMQLEAHGLPYNGSGVKSSSITIDKYRTLQILKRNGLPVTDQLLLSRQDYEAHSAGFLRQIEETFGYPLVAKPVDDGCSSAVKVIRDRATLEAYVRLIFGIDPLTEADNRRTLRLKPKEEFPTKQEILFEQLVTREAAIHFLEITGGMLTHYQPDGSLRYEVFEPSEALASGEVLSLEEKFLAGEGQNLTPARLATGQHSYQHVAKQVKDTLERAARILNVEGYCRIDAFVRVLPDGSAKTLVIEVNSLPGMTPATAIFHQAALAGYKPYEFIDKILEFGFQRERLRRGEPALVAETAAAAHAMAPPPRVPTYTPTAAEMAEELEPAPPTDGGVRFGLPYDIPAGKATRQKQSWRPTNNNGPWAFFSSTYFLKNLAALMAFLVGSFLLFTVFLKWYTRHGESRQVQSYVGMKLSDAQRKARSQGFRVAVIDSTFYPDQEPHRVLQQDPPPMADVKSNRTIYLSISGGTPPMITLPPLVGNYDYQQYTRKLEALKIRYAIKEQVYDARQEENSILYFFHGDKRITDSDTRRGVEVPQGAQLDFVVTVRRTGEVQIPALVCKKYGEAMFVMGSLDLMVGEIFGDVAVRESAYVWKQEPPYQPGQTIPVGTLVNIYLTDQKPEDCPVETDPPAYDPSLDEGLQEDEFGEPVDTSGGNEEN